MSSVVAFIESSPVSLERLANCMDFMALERPTVHFGAYGRHASVLFRSDEPDYDIKQLSSRTRSRYAGFHIRRLQDVGFVEVWMALRGHRSAEQAFRHVGLIDTYSDCVLAEQTMAHKPLYDLREVGLSVVDNEMAIAFCGGITWLEEQSSLSGEIKTNVINQGRNLKDSDWTALWIYRQLGYDHNYTRVLEQTPTYLFSVLIDATDKSLRLVGLRRNQREDGDVFSTDRLFVCKTDTRIRFASTESGVRVLMPDPLKSQNIHPVLDMEPVVYKFT